MHLADLNWMDVERYLAHDDRILLITGATEQHAYLSLLTDIKVPEAIAAAVARQEGVLVAPPLNFGCSGHFMEYPGTISLTQEIFSLVLVDIVRSLMQHGFYGFLILNGHGGNAYPVELDDLAQEIDGMRIVWYEWWKDAAAQAIANEIGHTAEHANWSENFPFTRVSEVPAAIKPRPQHDTFTSSGSSISLRDIFGDGSFGGPYQVDDAIMQRLFDAVVAEARALLNTL
ncbi:MAG: creatininase family protein [Anaerolineae bacterium]|nr:creatininase family protein [Anaerolineae bacterium]